MNKIFNTSVSFYSCKEEQGKGKKLKLGAILYLITNLDSIFPNIKQDIEDIRFFYSLTNPDSNAKKVARNLKGSLPCFTPAGLFLTKTRNGLLESSNAIVADIDDIDSEQYEKLNEELKKDKYVAFFFLSPSGQGLKIGFNVAFTDLDSFNAAMIEVSNYLDKNYNLTVDPSTFNINRLCYISYDPNIYVNLNAEELPISENTSKKVSQQSMNKQAICWKPYNIPDNIDEVRSNPTLRKNFNNDINCWLNKLATAEHPGRHAVLYNGAARLGNYNWFISTSEGLEKLKEMFIETYLNNHNGPDKSRKEAERTFDDGYKFGSQPERQRSLNFLI